MIKNFESYAEKQFYPALHDFASKNNLELLYQVKVYHDELFERPCKVHRDNPPYGYNERCEYCISDVHRNEKYRVDFVLGTNGKKDLAIEIDGEQYHWDKNKEWERDEYIKKSLTCEVLHVPANDALYHQAKVLGQIERYFASQESKK